MITRNIFNIITLKNYEYIPNKMYEERLEPPTQHSITNSKKDMKKDKQEVVIPLVERGVAAKEPETEECRLTRPVSYTHLRAHET